MAYQPLWVNAKAILVEGHLWYYSIHTFPKGISLKVNITMRLEFKLIYDNVIVQDVNHYAKETLPLCLFIIDQHMNHYAKETLPYVYLS